MDLGNIPLMDNHHQIDDNFSSDYAEEIQLINTVVLETAIKSDSFADKQGARMLYA